MQYTKKPITIEAIQWTGLNKSEIESFVGKELHEELESETAYIAGVAPPIFSLTITTPEGDMKAMRDDFIIKGIKGEFYPCKPDIFEASYNSGSAQTPISNAMHIVTSEIKSDTAYRVGWQANIAMAFKDEYVRRFPNPTDIPIHEIANTAADNFLDLLCR